MDTPGLLATDIHIQILIFLTRELSEPLWMCYIQRGSECSLVQIIWIWICEYDANNPGVYGCSFPILEDSLIIVIVIDRNATEG